MGLHANGRTMSLGTFIRLTTVEGDTHNLSAGDEPQLARAFRDFHEKGQINVLELTGMHGDPVVLSSDLVQEYEVSTPEGRAKLAEIARAALDERKANRDKYQLPPDVVGDLPEDEEWRRSL